MKTLKEIRKQGTLGQRFWPLRAGNFFIALPPGPTVGDEAAPMVNKGVSPEDNTVCAPNGEADDCAAAVPGCPKVKGVAAVVDA